MFELADIFHDHMVVQRDKKIAVFGCGTGNGVVFFNGRIQSFSADGPFLVMLPAEKAGGPYEMIISFTDNEASGRKRRRIVIRDVLVGDVFLAGGQSNMEFPLGESLEEEKTLAELTKVRYYKEPHNVHMNFIEGSDTVRGTVEITVEKPEWKLFTPKNEPAFSAAAYHFACRYFTETGIPVGIVECCKGASRADAWMSPETEDSEEVQSLLLEKHEDYEIFSFNQAHCLFENKLKNVIPYTLKGVLWYQGESNRGLKEAVNYDRLFAKMVENWRALWSDDLPFYMVQIMPFDEDPLKAAWSDIRLAQLRAAKNIPGVKLVTLQFTGEEKLIHPLHKKKVGEALANAALTDIGQAHEYCGPIAERAEFTDHTVTVSFSHANGLHFTGELLSGAEVLADGEPIFFDTLIEGGHLIFRTGSPADTVRMGCANVPEHDLYNLEGYPASPFEIFKYS